MDQLERMEKRWSNALAKMLATDHGDGLSLRPSATDPDRPEWRFSFVDAAGRKRSLAIGTWPEGWTMDAHGVRKRLPISAGMSADEARGLVDGLRAGDFRAVGLVALMHSGLRSWQLIDGLGEKGIEEAVERERRWAAYAARHAAGKDATRVLKQLDSLLATVRDFAEARGLKPADDGGLRAAA